MAISIETIAHFLWCMLPQPYPLYCTYICDEHVSCCMCIGRNFNSGRDDDDDNNNSSIPGAKLYGWYCKANRFMSHNDAIHWHQQFDCTRTHIPLHSTRIQMCMCEWSVGSKKNADVWMLMVLGDVSAVAVAAAAAAVIHYIWMWKSKWLLHALTMIFLSLCYTVCIVLAYFTLVSCVLLFFFLFSCGHPLTPHFFPFYFLSFLLHSHSLWV